MKKLFLFLIVLGVSFSPIYTYALSQSEVELVYQNFLQKISPYSSEKKMEIFGRIQNIAETYLYSSVYSNEKKDIIYTLAALNSEEIFSLEHENFLDQETQKEKESQYKTILAQELKNPEFPSYITKLLKNSDISFLLTSEKREFLQEDDIYRIQYSKYYKITAENIFSLSNFSGYVLYENNEFRFVEKYSLEKKVPYSQIGNLFGERIISDDFPTFEKNSFIYHVSFTNYKHFQDTYGIYQSELPNNTINTQSDIVFIDNEGTYNFITDFTSSPIISEESIFGVANKKLFLQYLNSDMKYDSENTAATFKSIRLLSNSLRSLAENKQDFIQLSYDWILRNISYSEEIDFSDMQIFSGIEAYTTKSGVCTAYVKLFAYMLLFGDISDIEMIQGYVIDAPDFPNVGHAWLRIGEKYYDPTFDDPIGVNNAKTEDEYLYYNLPADILYANRYTYSDIPDWVKTADVSEIAQLIYQNLLALVPKYAEILDQYPIFAPVIFRETYNISASASITPTLLASKIGYKTVLNNSFSYKEDGETINLKTYHYFALTNANIYTILSQIHYDFTDMKLFYWQTEDGEYEWRLAYDIELK